MDFEFHDRRSTLLSGIPANFRGNMPLGSGGPPRDQLVRDLNWLNEAGLLEDGTDPLAIWLRSAYRAAGGVQKAAVFRRALDQLQQPPEVVGAIWQAPSSRPEYREAVIHTEDRVPIQFLQDGQRAGESVALVSVTRYEQHEVSTRWPPVKGTGWLIGPTLLITAHHVVNARQVDEPPADDEDFIEQAQHARVTFGYDRDGQTGTAIGVARLVEQSRQLDYVILQLDADPGIPPLRLAKAEPAVSKDYHPPLNIIQHPYGHPKMLAFRNNLATTVAERPSDLGYFTDTDKGASGAPVFNDDWRVVAMHRATAQVDAVVFQGLETAWATSVPGSPPSWPT